MDLLKEMNKDLKEMNKDLKKHADELKKTLNNGNTRTPSTENKENKTNGKFKCDINKTKNKDNESEKINDNIPQIMKKEMTILVDNISDQVNKQIIATNKINVSGKFETYSTVKDFSRTGEISTTIKPAEKTSNDQLKENTANHKVVKSNEDTKIKCTCSECKFENGIKIEMTYHEEREHPENCFNCGKYNCRTSKSYTRSIDMHRKHVRLKSNKVYL